MKKIELPARLEDLLKRFEKMPVYKIRCHRCGKDWERLGKPPADFDGICPTCYDKGVRVGIGRSGSPMRAANRDEFLKSAGFPARLREGFHPWRVRGLDWMGGADAWALGYTGATRTGKSTLLAEIAWRNRERYRNPFFIRSDQLVSALFGRLGDEEKVRHYRTAVETPLLILDDLGWGNRGGAMDPVFEILALRHGNSAGTLWSSNTSVDELAATNAPLAGRLLEGLVVPLQEGEPWTKKRADK